MTTFLTDMRQYAEKLNATKACNLPYMAPKTVLQQDQTLP
jgi:hypothetical protein